MRKLLILAFLADENAPRLQAAFAAQSGITVRYLTVTAQSGWEVVAPVADAHPALIVVDLTLPLKWLSFVRSDPATRRIPVIGLGDGPDAPARGATYKLKAVYPVADFLAALPAPLTEHARAQPDSDALAQQCAAPPPPLVLRGLREFNRREFYECHETLEEAWMAESGPVRDLYRVILQVSVAYYHITNENYNGAIKMFLRAVQWFAPLPDSCQGIDIAALRENVTAVRAHLEALGPDRIRDFDRTLLKPIRYEGMST